MKSAVTNNTKTVRIYNTLTRRKDSVAERDIGMYVCGPTVYDVPHIGHARSAYVFDVILRYMKYRGKRITFVRNVTDIDDKIITKAFEELAAENGSGDRKDIDARVRDVAARYLKHYHEGMDALGLMRPDYEPKATETIDDMKEFIKILIDKGYAYEADGNVYFDVRKFKGYGRLSGQGLDQMEEGARVALDRNKRDPLDFALWKASKENEPAWPSPWGEGRPGWHIECSVMSTKLLGGNFLIHGGGMDLVFPHHENEIAQTVCAGKKPPKYWIHNGLLTINGRKMAKSLGNFITIKDFVDRHKNLNYLKIFFLSAHYKSPVDYTDQNIGEAKRKYERIDIFLRAAVRFLENFSRRVGRPVINYKGYSGLPYVNIYKLKFEKAMDDDFNTPEALAQIFAVMNFANAVMANKDSEDIYLKIKCARDLVLECLNNIFGLFFKEEYLGEDEKSLINERKEARKRKDFKKADEFREILERDYNIILEDTKEGTLWRRRL